MENSPRTDLLAAIRQENLTVYRSSPQRLREDVGQEAQISQDYRGRLIYELLQNADDAMEEGDPAAKICLRLTPDALWMANSGRPLDEPDIRGLCGISASSKGLLGKKRASIGHKGMGFKSVLEITDAPQVYSTTTSFRFSPADALKAVQPLIDGGLVPPVGRAPICRFPWGTDGDDVAWHEFRERGFRTAFRFPLRPKDKDSQFARIGEALRTLPESSLLFLKRLKCVEIEFVSERKKECIQWSVRRERHDSSGARMAVHSLSESGVYSVYLTNGREPQFQFILAYDSEIPIGQNRGGLNDYAWEGVELTEAAVAARVTNGEATELPPTWRRLHVFLPSAEPCPYELLISAAFNSNLSRQEIKVEQSSEDYNRFVLRQAASLFRDQLLPALLQEDVDRASVLRLLRRRSDIDSFLEENAAHAVHEAFKTVLADFPLIPTESQEFIPIPACVVPPLVDDPRVGEAFRNVLSDNASFQDKLFPASEYCGGDLAKILEDHGAYKLTPDEAAICLSEADPNRSMLFEHSSGGVSVDPVLSVLDGLYSGLSPFKQRTLAQKVKELPLFPVSETSGRVTRIATRDLQCFYPPRSLRGEMGLSGLCFLLQNLCWGALTPTERNEILAQEMPTWQALFEIHDFKFPDVMRASVLPALELDGSATNLRRTRLHSLEALAEICQLAGRMPDGSKPLPYERLGPNRALFNLSRLDVPCRDLGENGIKWVPAYRAYFGKDWLPEASFELVSEAIVSVGGQPPTVDFLIGPSRFVGLLDRFRHLQQAMDEDSQEVGDEEVALDEDEETALDSNERGRWEEFFRWLGVNAALRAVHFHDVEDRASGWLKTRGLRRPEGWAFSNVPTEKWQPFLAMVNSDLKDAMEENPDASPYFYQLHDLEHIVQLLDIAANDAGAAVARILYEHLARNWVSLERFTSSEIAVVAGEPARRTKPPRARGEELFELDEGNFWIYRLRRAAACPTTHGPRLPSQVWTPTQEVMRRFGRKGHDGVVCLLPTIDLPQNLLKGRARGLAQAMQIREELSPASFTDADALVVLNRLNEVYAARIGCGEDVRQALREVIRPAYRNLLELLTGKRNTSSNSLLERAPLLAQDGLGHFEFRPANEVFYVNRLDTRDRLQTDAPIWTFVLEAFAQGRGPLTELFGCRVLEDSLRWSPDVGDSCLSDLEKIEWQSRLRKLAPYILARVGADRADETLARRDAVLLKNLISSLEPVLDIRLKCSLDEKELPLRALDREAFVQLPESSTGTLTAFVRWGEHPWPPSEDDAESLATTFGEIFGAGYFESFLALIRAPSSVKRENLLRRAGAPTDIEEYRLRLFENDGVSDVTEGPTQPSLPEDPRTAAEHADGERPAQQPQSGQPRPTDTRQVPLYSVDQIVVDDMPVHLTGVRDGNRGKPASQRDATGPDDVGNDGDDAGGYGGHTDLEALNRLGMAITLAYEVVRLQKSGRPEAAVFDPAAPCPQPNALIFDVSSSSRIAKARASCPHFDGAYKRLIELHQVSPEWPGFDVLTLDPTSPLELQRAIELKSSGVCARVQEMSWNEWKTGRSSELRKRFYLYLVGNLRSDLNDSKPFIRTIRDPFEQLMAEVRVNKRVDRKVQLAVSQFREAEHLDLTVRADAPHFVTTKLPMGTDV